MLCMVCLRLAGHVRDPVARLAAGSGHPFQVRVEESPRFEQTLTSMFFLLPDLLEESRSARIFVGGVVNGKPRDPRLLLTLARDEIAELALALRVVSDPEASRCTCPGDFAIELRGRLLRIAVLSYHHALSLRHEESQSEALLFDGPAFLRVLAARGIPGPLAAYEAEQQSRRQAVLRLWRDAMPAPLRELAQELEVGPQGQPPPESNAIFDRAVAALRAGGDDDRDIAMAILEWFGTSTRPWNSYLGYEIVPFILLRRLKTDRVLAALLGANGPEALLGAARYVADYEIVSSHKSFLRGVTEDRFARFAERLATVPLSAEAMAHAEARLATARTVAAAARDQAAELAGQRSRELACVAISDDGPFRSLVTDGCNLAAVDGRTVVSIAPDRGKLSHLTTYEGSLSTELVFVGNTLLAVRYDEDRIDRISLKGGPRLLHVARITRPLSPLSCGGTLCCLSSRLETREVNGVRSSIPRTTLVYIDEAGRVFPITPVESAVVACTADATHVYYATSQEGQGQLWRAAPRGGRPEQIAKVGQLGQGMAGPVLQVVKGHLYFVDRSALCRVPVAGGRRETLYQTGREDEPLAALAVLADGFVLIGGGIGDGHWEVVRLQGVQRSPKRLGSLQRHPAERLCMVVCDGAAFFTLDDRLYRVR